MNNKSTVNFMSFNTGRRYTEDGQKIYATGYTVPDNYMGTMWEVVIIDLSRGIIAQFNSLVSFTDVSIMRAYDAGKYQRPPIDSQAYIDLVKHFHLEDTCNAL